MSLYLDIEKKLGNMKLSVALEAKDETVAVLGASGCGKSMTLKCIAGIERPDRGVIIVNGRTLYDSEKKINLSVQKRRVGLVFQNYALFPNMTVKQNIEAGARREKDKARRAELTSEYLKRFRLEDQANKYPSMLSGGQQQRVALARALVSAPDILLLDEPFSALDSHLRFQLQREVQNAIGEFRKTVLLVTHDRDEAYRMSERIAVMSEGKIEAVGNKGDVFAAPLTKESAVLTGCKNISTAIRTGDNIINAKDWGINLRVGSIPENMSFVGIRMHYIREGCGENHCKLRVEEVMENPFSFVYFLRASGAPKSIGWETDKQGGQRYFPGDYVDVSFPSDDILLLK